LTVRRAKADHRGDPLRYGGCDEHSEYQENASGDHERGPRPAGVGGADRGFFKDEGLDIEFVTTPGMAQVTTSHLVKFDSIFDRPLDSVYNEGGIDQYRMCEWGIMKRAVEANRDGLRGRKIVALGASMSKFAIVVAPDSKIYEPEMLKDKAIATTPNNGSDFTTLKMMEGFLAQEHIKRVHSGSMLKRLEAVATARSRRRA
jgi:hypothetical protein